MRIDDASDRPVFAPGCGVNTKRSDTGTPVVPRNDFDESHSAYKIGPGFWHYVPEADGELRLRLFEYRPGLFRNIAVASALGTGRLLATRGKLATFAFMAAILAGLDKWFHSP